MSASILPRWQRVPLRWFFERKLRKNGRPQPCPHCQGAIPPPRHLNDALWDMLVECPHCGYATSLMDYAGEWSKTPEEKLAEGTLTAAATAVSPPPTSRVAVENTGAARAWTLPAKGGCGMLVGFGAVWTAFSLFMLFAFLSGEKDSDSQIFPALFMGGFVVIGLAMLYGGLSMNHTHHELTLDSVELTHERHLFGRVKRKSLPRQDISSVELVVFYTENYKPVHGIEIIAGSRKIRFGSALSPEEKARLVKELRNAIHLSQGPSTDRTVAAARVADRTPVLGAPATSRIEIRQNDQGCVIRVAPGKMGAGIMVMGIVFMAVATFMTVMGARMWMPGSEGIPLPFQLLWNGFILFWCGGVGIFGLMGLTVTLSGWRMKNTRHQMTASPKALQILEIYGDRQHETLVPASEVRDIRIGHFETIKSSAESGKTPDSYHRAIILLQDQVIGFGGGCNLSELNAAVTALKNAMGREEV